MTRDNLTARVRFNLADAGVTYYSADDLNDSIQDAYDEVVALTACIESAGTMAFVSDQIFYNAIDDISDFMRPIAVKNSNTLRFLDIIFLKSLDSFRDDWEQGVGSSEYLGLIDSKWMTPFPHMGTGAGNLEVFYKASANTLGASTVPTIPTQFQKILEFYSTADMLEQMEEFEQAGKAWQDYIAELQRFKNFLKDRVMSDRIAQLSAQYFGRGI